MVILNSFLMVLVSIVTVLFLAWSICTQDAPELHSISVRDMRTAP